MGQFYQNFSLLQPCASIFEKVAKVGNLKSWNCVPSTFIVGAVSSSDFLFLILIIL